MEPKFKIGDKVINNVANSNRAQSVNQIRFVYDLVDNDGVLHRGIYENSITEVPKITPQEALADMLTRPGAKYKIRRYAEDVTVVYDPTTYAEALVARRTPEAFFQLHMGNFLDHAQYFLEKVS